MKKYYIIEKQRSNEGGVLFWIGLVIGSLFGSFVGQLIWRWLFA